MTSDTWTLVTSMSSGTERQYSSGFSSGNYGYVFGGVSASGVSLNDLWCYNPQSDTWTQKSSKPGNGCGGAVSFQINNIAYIIGGSDSGLVSNEVWSYNIATDNWIQKSNFPFGGRWRASGTSLNGKGYLLFGVDQNDLFRNELYEYDPLNDVWTQLSAFPGDGKSYSSVQTIGNNLISFGGIDSSNVCSNELWKYDVAMDQWTALSPLPSVARKGGLSFTNNSSLYYTTGIDQQSNRLKQTWKTSDLTSIVSSSKSFHSLLFPNPANNLIYVDHNSYVEVYTIHGKQVLKNTLVKDGRVDVSHLANGLYLVSINKSAPVKLIISR